MEKILKEFEEILNKLKNSEHNKIVIDQKSYNEIYSIYGNILMYIKKNKNDKFMRIDALSDIFQQEDFKKLIVGKEIEDIDVNYDEVLIKLKDDENYIIISKRKTNMLNIFYDDDLIFSRRIKKYLI